MESIARLMLLALSVLRPAERLSAGASRLTAAAMCTAAVVLALAIGLGCLIAAAWIALIPLVGPVSAALIAAAGFFMVAAVLWLIARARMDQDKVADAAEPMKNLHDLLEDVLGNGAGSDLKRFLGEHKIPLLLAALVAGLTMGGNGPGRRRR